MLFQPTNIVPDDVNGSGCVDAAEDLEISWQVNGDSAMVAYSIKIQKNAIGSMWFYSTGKVSLQEPFWGREYNGDIQRFSVELAPTTIDATSTEYINGEEYKITITQWWDSTNSVTQITSSVFKTRATPQISINTIPSPVTTKEYTFEATYLQSDGDPLNYFRWMIAQKDYEDEPLFDTGIITGTGDIRVTYDGFITDLTYTVRCIIETINNVQADTGWVDFDVEYSTLVVQGTAQACQVNFVNAVYVSWDFIENAYGYSVMRRKKSETRLSKVVDVPNTVGQIRDYEATSGETYIYYVFPDGQVSFLTGPMITNEVNVKYSFWVIVEAKLYRDKSYVVIAEHYFRYGMGGVNEGAMSNNNSPSILKNFTKYPTRQGLSQNYKTGSISGYVGTISNSTREYSDTVQQTDKIMELSASTNALFLNDPKGHFLRIHTNGEIKAQTDIAKTQMPVTITVPWVEVGSTEGITLTSTPEDTFYPIDNVIFTTIEIDMRTGSLVWTTPNDYRGGSELLLRDGNLIQDTFGSFTSATMQIDSSTKILTAEITPVES